MRITSDRLGLLQTFGFSENQARVYLALLEYPELAAGALGKAAQVPRNRLYEVLSELQALGLVEVILGNTRTYRANTLTSFLDRRVSELQEQADDLASRREFLAVAFQPVKSEGMSLEPGATRALLGRRAVAREIDRMLEETIRSIALAGSVGGFPRMLEHLASFEARAGGLDVEIFLPAVIASAGGVDRLGPRLAACVRWIPAPLGTVTVVRDEAEILSIRPVPDDGRLRVGDDFATLTTDEVAARDRLALLRIAAGAPMTGPRSA